MSHGTTPSAKPSAWAKPELVVAKALKPRPCRRRAVPTFHGLGMMKQPERCSSLKVRRLSATDGRDMGLPPFSVPPLKHAARERPGTTHSADRSDQRR